MKQWHCLGLILWMAIAATLRFTNLTLKPLWTDEFSTLVFSLGNSFLTVPLDRAISLSELLQPLQPHPGNAMGDVLNHLFAESNHPPLYFLLTHLWLQLFPSENGLVSVWAARSLAALFGVMAVPASFWLGWIAFRSPLVGHLSAAGMALSPFGIYLAQEARHYTLAVVWIALSLVCLVTVARYLRDRHPIPLWLCLAWITVNSLGIATHYFVLFSLVAAAIALIGFLLNLKISPSPSSLPSLLIPNRWRLSAIATGTLAGAIVWLPVFQKTQSSELTRWIQQGEFDHSGLLEPLLRSLAGITTMLYLLPIQSVPLAGAIAAGIALILLILGTGWLLVQGWRSQYQDPESRLGLQVLGGFVIAAIALSLVVTYGFGMNVASVFRYQFFFFPAVIVLIGAGLAPLCNVPAIFLLSKIKLPKIKAFVKGGIVLGIIAIFCLLGALTVVTNFGYQKTHRPEVVAQAIQASSQFPTLIAIPHKTHGQTGRLMGIAWDLQRLAPTNRDRSQFLLAHARQRDVQPAIVALRKTLESQPRPLDVWRINFRSEANPLSQAVLNQQGCVPGSKLLSIDGYRYQKFACGHPP